MNTMTPNDPGSRRERKRAQLMDHLSDTAWALFEAEGFDNVTMEGIAASADVAKATLYKHFPVKEELLRYRFHRELTNQAPASLARIASLAGIRAQFAALFHEAAHWAEAHRTYLGHYLRFRLRQSDMPQAEQRSGIDRVFAMLLAQAQARGELRPDLPSSFLARQLEFLYLSALLRWISGTDVVLTTELNAVLALFFDGAILTQS